MATVHHKSYERGGSAATTCALQADHVAAEVRKVQFKRLEKEAEAKDYEV